MSAKPIDYSGRKLGHAVVLDRAGHVEHGAKKVPAWSVKCGCGTVITRSATVIGNAIKRNGVVMCETCDSRWKSVRARGRNRHRLRGAAVART